MRLTIKECTISELGESLGEITPSKVTQGKSTCCVPQYAIDKDLLVGISIEADNIVGWFKMELDQTHHIHTVLIYYKFYTHWFNPDEYCVQSENRFRGCVDWNNNVDVTVYQKGAKQKSCGTLQLTYGLEQSDQIYTMFCNVEGDSVQLTKTTGRIQLQEITVIGKSMWS